MRLAYPNECDHTMLLVNCNSAMVCTYLACSHHFRYGYEFKASDPSFNAGVFAINLDLWRKGQLLDEALYWMKQVIITIMRYCGHLDNNNRMLIIPYGSLALNQ